MRVLVGAIVAAMLATAAARSTQDRQPPARPAGSFTASSTQEQLLHHADVQKELKLSSQQIQQINQIARDVREKHKDDFENMQNLAAEQRRRRQAELADIISQEIVSALTNILEPRQAKRFEQLHLQQQGLKAFTDPKIERALRLTEDQKKKLKTINDAAAKEAAKLVRSGAPGSFQEALKKINRVRRNAVEKSVALLSDEQKKVWHELVGEPFQVESEPPLIRPPAGAPGEAAGSKP